MLRGNFIELEEVVDDINGLSTRKIMINTDKIQSVWPDGNGNTRVDVDRDHYRKKMSITVTRSIRRIKGNNIMSGGITRIAPESIIGELSNWALEAKSGYNDGWTRQHYQNQLDRIFSHIDKMRMSRSGTRNRGGKGKNGFVRSAEKAHSKPITIIW